MRLIHTATWVGLALNAFIVVMAWYLVGVIGSMQLPEGFDPIPPEELQQIPQFLSAILILQAVAVWMLLRKISTALILASLSSLPFLPFSVVYLIGCLHMYYAGKASAFTLAYEPVTRSEKRFRDAQSSTVFFSGLALVVSTFMLILGGHMSFAMLCLSIGFILIYFSTKTYWTSIAFFKDYVWLAPNIMSAPIALEYKYIQSATFNVQDMVIVFQVMTSEGSNELSWSLNRVRDNDKKEAFETLGARLMEHKVALYQK